MSFVAVANCASTSNNGCKYLQRQQSEQPSQRRQQQVNAPAKLNRRVLHLKRWNVREDHSWM